jgi:hypothetical protein
MLGAQGHENSSPEQVSRKNRACYHGVHPVGPRGRGIAFLNAADAS